MRDPPGGGVGRVHGDQRLREMLREGLHPVVLRAEIIGGAAPGVEGEGVALRQVGAGKNPLAGLGVDRERIVAVLLEDGGGDFEFAARRVESRRPVRPQQPFLPLLVLHHRPRDPHRAPRGPHFLQGESRPRQGVAQNRLLALRVEVPVAEAVGQIGQDEEVAARLPLGLHQLLADLEDRAVAHVGGDLVAGGGRQDDVRVGGVGSRVAVDADEEVERLEGPAPQRRVGPAGEDGASQDDQRADLVRLPLEDRVGKGDGMRFPPVMAVDGEALAPQGLFHVGVGDEPRAVLGKGVLPHADVPAAGNVELPGEPPQGEDGADRLHAAVRILQPGVHDRAGAPGRGEGAGEGADRRRRDAGDPLHHFGPEVLHVAAEVLEADGPFPGELLVVELLLHQDLDHPQGEGAVGSRAHRHPLGPGLPGGAVAARVDGDDPGAPGVRPQDLLVGQGRGVGGRVGAPEDDEFGLLQVMFHGDVHLPHGRMGGDHGERDVAERAHPERVGGAEGEEDAGGGGDRHPRRLEEVAHGHVEAAPAGVDGGRLGPRFGLDRLQAAGDFRHRRSPRRCARNRVSPSDLCGAADISGDRGHGRSAGNDGRWCRGFPEGCRAAARRRSAGRPAARPAPSNQPGRCRTGHP